MDFAPLGRDLSPLVLGTMVLTTADPDAGAAVLDEYVRLGGNVIDTARVYGDGDSEHALGAWLERRADVRDRLVVITKGAHHVDGRKRVTPADIDHDLRASIEALRGPVDLYLLHRDDPSAPVGPVVEHLNAQREAGLMRAFGTSNWTTARIDEANAYAAANGLEGFCVSSQHLSLAAQNEEHWEDTRSANDPAIHEWHTRTQTPLLAWSSLARGYFAGRDDGDVGRVYDSEESRERRRRASEVGDRLGRTADQVALAWVLHQPFPVYAAVGVRTVEQLRDRFGALEIDPAELAGLTA
ncbi:MAG TPA: aldo/keto reductase [Solirubrobacteraceae bacterium]|nr:aldo/keto reductase [Solirubrobacteraceae bacterium]